jgi:hypothetical protein
MRQLDSLANVSSWQDRLVEKRRENMIPPEFLHQRPIDEWQQQVNRISPRYRRRGRRKIGATSRTRVGWLWVTVTVLILTSMLMILLVRLVLIFGYH